MIIRESIQLQLFNCGQCDYQFKRRDHLKSYKLSHRDPLEMKLFKYNKCEYHRRFQKNLQKHLLVHKDPTSNIQI